LYDLQARRYRTGNNSLGAKRSDVFRQTES
jgi:hypothetical protein